MMSDIVLQAHKQPVRMIKNTARKMNGQPFADMDMLLKNAANKVLMKDQSMAKAGVPAGSYLLIDQQILPKNGDIIWCCYEGEWLVRFYERHNGQITLYAAQPGMQAIRVTEPLDIKGVVIWAVKCIHNG